MSRSRYPLIALVAFVAMAISSSSAQAAFQMRLTDLNTNTSVTITDEVFSSPADTFVGPGVVSWSGSLGTFIINVSTGISKPVLGSAALPHMDLNSVNVSGGAGSLRIELTDTGFSATGPGSFNGSVGGTVAAGGSAVFNAFKSLTNLEFSQANLAATYQLGSFGAGSFSGDASTLHSAILNPYSITMVALITHTGTGNSSTSFDWGTTNTPVPEPATVMSAIFGLPMIGGYLVRRRRKLAETSAV